MYHHSSCSGGLCLETMANSARSSLPEHFKTTVSAKITIATSEQMVTNQKNRALDGLQQLFLIAAISKKIGHFRCVTPTSRKIKLQVSGRLRVDCTCTICLPSLFTYNERVRLESTSSLRVRVVTTATLMVISTRSSIYFLHGLIGAFINGSGK